MRALHTLKTYGLPGTPPPPLSLERPQSLTLHLEGGDADYFLEVYGAHAPFLDPPSPSGAAPSSGSASLAWRSSHGRQLTGSAQSEAGEGGDPGRPRVYRLGLQVEDGAISR